jgi:hypothetical protein
MSTHSYSTADSSGLTPDVGARTYTNSPPPCDCPPLRSTPDSNSASPQRRPAAERIRSGMPFLLRQLSMPMARQCTKRPFGAASVVLMRHWRANKTGIGIALTLRQMAPPSSGRHVATKYLVFKLLLWPQVTPDAVTLLRHPSMFEIRYM